MEVNIVTQEDLTRFKRDLIEEIKKIVQPQETKRWLRSDEIKKLLKVSPGTLQTLRINGTLTFTKVGGIIFYDYNNIMKVMEENKKEAYR